MKTILVPVDFSNVTGAVLDHAGKLAEAVGAGILLLHIAPPEPEFVGYDPGPQSVRDAVAKQLADVHHRLHELDAGLTRRGIEVTSLVIQGYAVEKILAEAKKHEVDLIVMGSHGHGMLRQLLVGSVAEGVMREATCPVTVVPHRAAED